MLSLSIGQEAGCASERGASGKKKSSSSSRPVRRVVTVNVKESRNSPGVAQRVPGGLGFQIS